MKILSIDTSTKTGSVAVLESEKVLVELSYTADSSHSKDLILVIDKALKKAKLELSEINGIAVSIGPGSFTGLRIGLATAKGLAFALNKPIVGISTLEALAFISPLLCTCPPVVWRKEGLGEVERIIPCLNAYRGEVYCTITNECSIAPEELCRELLKYECDLLFVGDGAIHYKELFKEKLGKRFILAKGESFPIAKNVGLLALEKFERKEFDDIRTLAPNYVRRPDAELKNAAIRRLGY